MGCCAPKIDLSPIRPRALPLWRTLAARRSDWITRNSPRLTYEMAPLELSPALMRPAEAFEAEVAEHPGSGLPA
jgi:hypothetical protein